MEKIILAFHKYKPETEYGHLKTLSCEQPPMHVDCIHSADTIQNKRSCTATFMTACMLHTVVI